MRSCAARSARELDGMRYERLFDYLPASGDICRVRTAEFVTTEDGTGIVHVAPAYGEDDLEARPASRLARRCTALARTAISSPSVHAGRGQVFQGRRSGHHRVRCASAASCFARRSILHNYPFGWRTGDPLIYYAKNAWYIRTTEFRERMVELNKTIKWVPEHIRDGRFGNWLENNIDWALSRERFWGTPLPLWTDGAGRLRLHRLRRRARAACRPQAAGSSTCTGLPSTT